MNNEEYWNLFDYAYNQLNKCDNLCINDKITDNKIENTKQIECKMTKNDSSIEINECTSCGFIEYNSINVCTNCGLIFNDRELCDEVFTNLDDNGDINNTSYCGTFKRVNTKYNRIVIMKNWYTWSNDEKLVYKLSNYTKKLCDQLNIIHYIDYICNLVNTVLYKVKENDGCKRTKVKDGIIIVCIYYVYTKNNVFVNPKFNPNTLSKLINLDIKYITRAEKSIMELINKNKIKLDKNIFYSVKSPMSYIIQSSVTLNIKKELLNIIYVKTQELIDKCEKEELLIGHTPLSIGIGCFYFILIQYELNVDISHFAKVYNLSNVTIFKIFKKLKSLIN